MPFVAEQGAGGRRDVALPHQAFADQEGRDAYAGEVREIGGRGNSTLADGDALPRNLRCQPLAGGERGLEGPKIAVVDADQPGTAAERPVELVLVVNLYQNVHA